MISIIADELTSPHMDDALNVEILNDEKFFRLFHLSLYRVSTLLTFLLRFLSLVARDR